ncbi:MAG: molybdenum cofactor guanylyltransferase [Elainellaceae cyanobacterium]
MSPITAIILAGGQSSRMGEDKALLSWRGKPFIRCIYEAAIGCSDRVIVVTPWPQRYRDHLPTHCDYIMETRPPKVPQDTIQGAPQSAQGPLVGFYQGVSAVETDWVLLLACDLPRLQPDQLREWADQLEALPAQTMAFLPQQAKGWEPLCGFYHRRCQESLGHFIAMGGRSFQRWLQQQPVCPIPLSPAAVDMLYNCNTPEDIRILRAKGGYASDAAANGDR